MKQIIVAMTGATGALYTLRLLDRLLAQEQVCVHFIASPWAQRVVQEETGTELDCHLSRYDRARFIRYDHSDLASSLSSGSFCIDAMVIIPCTMGTLGAIASGLSSNLIERASAVTMKERRPLILVARETPLNTIALQQMLNLSQAGAMILPPMPAFYGHPTSVEDLVDTTVDRVLDELHLGDENTKRWGSV